MAKIDVQLRLNMTLSSRALEHNIESGTTTTVSTSPTQQFVDVDLVIRTVENMARASILLTIGVLNRRHYTISLKYLDIFVHIFN